MATRIIYFNTVSEDTAVPLTTGQDVFVRAGVLVGSEGGTAIAGDGGSHTAVIEGEVVGSTIGLSLGSSPFSETRNDVIVRAGARVTAFSDAGINIDSADSTLTNHGYIFGGDSGVSILGVSDSTQSTIVNSGIIEALDTGIVHTFTTGGTVETLVVKNTGTISGGENSFYGVGTAVDLITNTGKMIGAINLGSGDDLYDGRGGHVIGTVFGGSGVDTLYGGTDADTLDGGAGDDIMTGGLGNDIYLVDSKFDKVYESSNQGTDTIQTLVSYVLSTSVIVENIDIIKSALQITVTGNAYANKIFGGNLSNRVSGGAGNDTLTGGAGGDSFLFNSALNATTNVDRITDFGQSGNNNDEIRLENAIFTTFKATGAMAAGAFASNTSGVASQADDRIVYETDTGKLFYDTNGNASGGATLFAILDYKPALSASDFLIV